MIELYTDGACSSKKKGGWSFVVLKELQKIYFDFGMVLDTTNNRMEIFAVIKACEFLNKHGYKKATLYSDSMYVIGTQTLQWQKRKNLDLWEQLDKVLEGLDIQWIHVKGHANNTYNILCDALAVEGSKLIN